MSVVVVTGTRSLVDSPARALIKSHFIRMIEVLNPVVVHHGGAIGPDSWACDAFQEIQRMHRPVKTDNRMDAIQALFARNKSMVDLAEDQAWTLREKAVMVACWDGTSRGSKDASDYAQSKGLHVVWVPVTLCEAYVACQIARG